MPIIYLILILLLLPIQIFAAPSVSSTSGSILNGYSVIVSGSNFGTAPTIYKWDNFEGATHTIGQAVGDGPGAIAWNIATGATYTNPIISADTNRGISTKFVREQIEDKDAGGSGKDTSIFQYINGSPMPVIYATAYMRTTGDTDYGNQKWWGFRGPNGWESIPDPTLGLVTNSYLERNIWRRDLYEEPDISEQTRVAGYAVSDVPANGAWLRVELYGVSGTSSDGSWTWTNQVALNGAFISTGETNVTTHDSGRDWGSVVFEAYIETTGDAADIYKHDYDDIYIANSPARVEIGNNATFASCTHREIQPHTAWASGSITVTVNRGSFALGDSAYLFVIDENGAASAGEPITFSYGGSVALTGGTGSMSLTGGNGSLTW